MKCYLQKLLVTECERQEREMQMRDDLGITTKLENGKAYLEFALPEKIGRLLSALQIEIWEGAEGERLVFHGEYSFLNGSISVTKDGLKKEAVLVFLLSISL